MKPIYAVALLTLVLAGTEFADAEGGAESFEDLMSEKAYVDVSSEIRSMLESRGIDSRLIADDGMMPIEVAREIDALLQEDRELREALSQRVERLLRLARAVTGKSAVFVLGHERWELGCGRWC